MSRVPMYRRKAHRPPSARLARLRHLIPMKPRKPPSGFNLHVRETFRDVKGMNLPLNRPQGVMFARLIWRNNPARLRDDFNARARPELDRYRVMLQEYKRKIGLLKQPGNPYTFFARDLWKREGQGKEFSVVASLAGTAWRGMTVAEKKPFVDQAERAKDAYARMFEDLSAGRTTLDDYIGAANQQPPELPAIMGDVLGD